MGGSVSVIAVAISGSGEYPMVDIYAVAKSPIATPAPLSASAENPSSTEEKEKCNLSRNNQETDKFECSIFASIFTDVKSKKHISTSSFTSPIKSSKPSITVDSYYKINVSEKVWLDWNKDQSKKIEIFSGKTKLTDNLVPLFMINNGSIFIPEEKTPPSKNIKKYFVGTVKQIVEGSYSASTTQATSVSKSSNTTGTDAKNYECISSSLWYLFNPSSNCNIYDFSSSIQQNIEQLTGLASVVFRTPSSISNTLEDKGFYLIESTSAPLFVTNFENKNDLSKRMKFTNVKPAIYVEQTLFMVW